MDASNRLWVADICRIPTGEGPLWLASVRDAFSRRIVGWKASDRADVELVLGALEYPVWGRGLDGDPAQRRLIHHSDRGAQYTAIRFTQRLADAGIQPSMGSVGDSFDTQSRICGEGCHLVGLTRHSSGLPGSARGGLRHDGRGRRLGV